MHHDLLVIFDGPDESAYFSHFETKLGIPSPKFVGNLLEAHIYVNTCDAEKAIEKIRRWWPFENAVLGHFVRKAEK